MFAEWGHLLEKVVVDCTVPLDVAHYILMALSVREETGPSFALLHPFASWFCTLLVSFSGTFLTNFLLGDSLLVPLMSKSDIMLFTVIWYHVSILDSFAGIFNWKPVKNVICVAKEFQRNHKIMLGVHSGATKFVDHTLLQVLVGCTKGNGSGVVKIVQQFVYGKWVPTENELLKPSTTTKATILTAILYASSHISHDVAYLCGAVVLVGSKVLSLAGVSKSPLDQPYDRLRFTVIEAPRMLESLICGGSSEVAAEQKPLIEEAVKSSSEVPQAEKEKKTEESVTSSVPPPTSVPVAPWTLEEWQRKVAESLDEIAEMGRSNQIGIGKVTRAVCDLDEGKTETVLVQTQILSELRELKGLILAHPPKPPRSPNPSLDSTVILNAPEDTVDEDD